MERNITEKTFSYCRGCVSCCGLEFEVDRKNNRIVSHGANEQNLVSEGYSCIKGDMSVAFLQGKEKRYEQSQKRQPDGSFRPIETQQMMDEVAAAISSSIQQYGPGSVALYVGTAGYRKSFNLSMAKQLMGLIGSTKMFSTMTIDQSAHWVVDGRMGLFATGRPFLQDVDVLIYSGTNPVISHAGPYQPAPLVNQARKFKEFKEKGGKIIVVDPRKSETAKRATLHIQPRPGTDTEIFAGLIRILLEKGWYDHAFCARYVTHLDALKQAVASYTPEFVAQRAGIPAAQLHEAAEIIRDAKKISAGFGTGTSMSPNPNTAAHMIEGLNAICGAYARAGEIAHNPGIWAKRSPVEMVIPPTRSWESEPKLASGFGTFYGEFPSSRLPEEMLREGPDRIRTLIVLGANPMVAFGEPDRMRQALESLDCLVVIEPRETETSRLATYVVAPPVQYEVEDFNLLTASWTEDPIVQYTQPVVQPPPGVIEEWKFFNGIANRLGHTLKLIPFSFGGSGTGNDDALALVPGVEWSTHQLIQRAFDDVGISLDEVARHPEGWRLDNTPQTVQAPPSDDGNRLDVCPPDVASELEEIAAVASVQTRRYQLLNRRITELMNSEFRFGEPVQKRFTGAPLYMHPADMEAEGFGNGDMVVIAGDHGRIRAGVKADPTLRPGTVAMPHNWSGDPASDGVAGITSWLVSMHESHVQRIDAMPQQSALPVSLERAQAVG